jgi:hypothetical protein
MFGDSERIARITDRVSYIREIREIRGQKAWLRPGEKREKATGDWYYRSSQRALRTERSKLPLRPPVKWIE